MSYRRQLRRLEDRFERVKAARSGAKQWPMDPVDFCNEYLKFKPTAYQEKLLRDPAQFIAARWSRQSGKTHCVAVLLLWSCLRNQGFNVLVIAPSIRQSKIIIRKITGFLPKLPKYVALKPQKTKIEFYNGSRIQAFPNSPETIRGEPGVNLVYCLPHWTRILRPDGQYTPISQLKQGELVATFNTFTKVIETKRILKVIRNPIAGRRIVRINHDRGFLECTSDHRVFTDNRGYIPASGLTTMDQLLTQRKIQASTLEELQPSAGAGYPRRSLRRLQPVEAELFNERPADRESFLQTSRVRSVQVLDSERFRQDSPTHYQESRVGNLERRISYSFSPKTDRDLRAHVSEWQEDNFEGVVGQNNIPLSARDLVHGRRFKQQVQCTDLYSLFFSCRLSTSTAVALIQVGSPSFHSGRQAWGRLLSPVESGRTGEALPDHPALHNTQHDVQGACLAEEDEKREDAMPTSPTISSQLRDLYSTVRNGQTKSDHMQQAVWPREETANASIVQNSVQPSKKASTDDFQDGEGNTSENMHLLRKHVSTSEQSSTDLQRDVFRDVGSKEQAEIRTANENGTFVYDLEVEGNHNFFANHVLVSNCDEMSYIRDDKDLYEATIFSLVTTNGRFLATSTPGSRESMFYAMCTDDINFGDVSRHHVTYLDALEPNGPLKLEILEKLKRQFASDPWRWRREMEAEFADDEDAWLSMGLITRCVDQNLEYIPEDLITTSS